MLSTTLTPSLVDRIWPAARSEQKVLRAVVLALAGSLLLWASAKAVSYTHLTLPTM